MWSKWRGSLRRITLRSLNEYIQTMGVLRSLPNHAFTLNATVQGTRRHVQIFVDSNKNTSRSRGNSRFLPGTHRRTSEWPELCVTARHVVRSAASSDAGIKLR
jgi:hypothetical protein